MLAPNNNDDNYNYYNYTYLPKMQTRFHRPGGGVPLHGDMQSPANPEFAEEARPRTGGGAEGLASGEVGEQHHPHRRAESSSSPPLLTTARHSTPFFPSSSNSTAHLGPVDPGCSVSFLSWKSLHY